MSITDKTLIGKDVRKINIGSISSKKKKNLLFYCAYMAFPVLQFVVFYIIVNFNSFRLVFQTYEDGKYIFSGFENFRTIFSGFRTNALYFTAVKNSFTLLFFSVVIGAPLGLLFSYFIYKKMIGSEIFRVILFLPSILSAVVIVIIFQNFVDVFLPGVVGKINENSEFIGFLADDRYTFATLIFYAIWVSFGSTTLLYSSAMSGISESIVEAAHLDGANTLQEFCHITFPMVYSTFSIFTVVAVAGVFTNQMHLYSFYLTDADPSLRTIGYELYRRTYIAGNGDYPVLATFGILFSLISIPLTLFLRWLLRKIGPTTE